MAFSDSLITKISAGKIENEAGTFSYIVTCDSDMFVDVVLRGEDTISVLLYGKMRE